MSNGLKARRVALLFGVQFRDGAKLIMTDGAYKSL
jgi:hypothetical protein